MDVRRTVAIIDVGSNSVRLLVARELTDSAFEVLDEERFDARLGQGQVNGMVAPAAFERGLRAMRVMSEVARSHHPDMITTVGTEALRRAPNAPEFIATVKEQAGLEVRLLSAQEEAYASFLGVVNSTPIRDGSIVDLGGGSLELIKVEERSLTSYLSVPLGSIYATQRYLKHDPPTRSELRELRNAVLNELGNQRPSPVLYGVGGAIRNMARIIRQRRGYPLRRIHGLILKASEVEALRDSLVATDAEGRCKIPRVSDTRGEYLHAAAVVIAEAMRLASAKSLVISGQGLREGLAWQALRGESPVLSDVRAASVDGLLHSNGVLPASARVVAEVARQLFDATKTVHGLKPIDLELLLAAARLASMGIHVEYYDRDRHAQYLVHSGDLHGFSHREIVLLGALVRCADGGPPDLSPYMEVIEAGDQRRVALMAAILGVARAITRRTPTPVVSTEAKLRRKVLRVELAAHEPVDAELLALERQQQRFESTLGIALKPAFLQLA